MTLQITPPDSGWDLLTILGWLSLAVAAVVVVYMARVYRRTFEDDPPPPESAEPREAVFFKRYKSEEGTRDQGPEARGQ
jgi:hypothetical protein